MKQTRSPTASSNSDYLIHAIFQVPGSFALVNPKDIEFSKQRASRLISVDSISRKSREDEPCQSCPAGSVSHSCSARGCAWTCGCEWWFS